MRYLIQNVWYWRARLVVDSLEVEDGKVHLSVSNLGRASTSNATLVYFEDRGDFSEIWFPGSDGPIELTGEQKGGVTQIQLGSDFNFSTSGYGFAVNATNSTVTTLDFRGAPISSGEGVWALYYQKRVVDSSMWVFDIVNESVVEMKVGGSGLLPAPSMLLVFVAFALAAINGRNSRFEH